MHSPLMTTLDARTERCDVTMGVSLTHTPHSIPVPAPEPLRHTILLIDMVRMQQWQLLLDNPTVVTRRQAKLCDAYGLYPLHWAVSGNAPMAVIHILMAAYPSARKRADQDQCTPLHLAAQNGHDEAVSYLQQVYPRAAHRLDRYGRSPLWYAVQQRLSFEAIMGLARIAPNMIVTPSRSHRPEAAMAWTPLFRIWTQVLQDPKGHANGATWNAAVGLLLTAYHQLLVPGLATPLVTSHMPVDCRQVMHAAICMDAYLPESVLAMLVSRFPEQLRHENAQGQWPLSAAVALSDSGSMPHRQDDGRLFKQCQKRVHLLLEAFPGGAHHMNPRNGRSALMEAIASGHKWTASTDAESSVESNKDHGASVLQQLFEAAPDMIHGRDGAGMGSLPPALLAAATAPRASARTSQPTTRPTTTELPNTLPLLLSVKMREGLLAVAPLDPFKGGGPVAVSGCVEADHVTTIFTLLRANPSQLIAF